jgi:HEAT repeat protein
MSRAEAAKATQALIRWFDCESCGEADLTAVTRHGQGVVPSLIATLNAGLSPASRQALHDSFAARYDALDEQARKDPKFKMKSTKDEFIARYVDQHDARNRIRAAEALGAIGGTNARTALQTALANAKRADVRKAIQEALQQIR